MVELLGAMAVCEHQGLRYYRFPAWAEFAKHGLVHGFSGRSGGVSEGYYATLNLAFRSNDRRENVLENYRRLAAALELPLERLVFSEQQHHTNIRHCTMADGGKGIFRERDYADIDGLITAERGLPLLTFYADCTPLFFYAPKQQVIGLAHAGWRGTALKMAAAMVQAFAAYGVAPAELFAAIGPAAGPCCYQVGAEVAGEFAAWADEAGPVLRADPQEDGKYFLDLWRANRLAMLQAGIPPGQISVGGICTVCHADEFFSHRATAGKRGCMAAAMMLREED